MFSIAICDDEAQFQKILKGMVARYMKQLGIVYSLKTFDSGNELVEYCATDPELTLSYSKRIKYLHFGLKRCILLAEVNNTRRRQYINNPEELLAQGKEIVTQSADNKFVHRVSMVNLILSGMTPEELSAYSGDSRRVLYDWVTKVDEQGWDSLKAVKQQGRAPKLSDDQLSELRAVVEGDPEAHGYHVWDGPTLSEYIRNHYGVDLGVRACQILMQKMGFSLIRPQTYPSLENPDNEAREEFKKK